MFVTRQKLYQRHGAYAWKWLYTVHLPDGTTAEAGSKDEVNGVIAAWNRRTGSKEKAQYVA